MTKRIILATSHILLTICSLSAQSTHAIKGTVVDEDGAPFPFVNIFLTNSKTGTITNGQGAFALNLSRSEDVLNVSSMGYETQSFAVNRDTRQLNIQLKPSSTQLNDFILTNLTAAALLRRAIEKIPENFRQEPFLSKIYMRNKLLEADTLRFIQELEYNAIKSYHRSFTNEFFLVRNRNFRFVESRIPELLMGSGVPDMVKEISGVFNESFFRNNDIRFLPSSTFDNRPVYVLEYSRNNSGNGSKGKVYIDVEDLAFVRFELGNDEVFQYRKIDDKWFLMSGNWVYINNKFGRIRPAESEFLTTEIILDFSREDIKGTRVVRDDVLSAFETHEQDTTFWQQHSAILPDSTVLEAMERYMHNPRVDRLAKMNSVQREAHLRRLYEPNISLVASTDLLNDFSIINHNFHSINRLSTHFLFHNLRGVLLKSLTYGVYLGVAMPISDTSSEWFLLNKNGIRAQMFPSTFNVFSTSFNFNLHGINSATMSDFKNDSYLDFMRLHTIRNEGRYIRTFLLEEEIAKIDLSNRNNWINYVLLYTPQIWAFRLNDIFHSNKDIKESNKPETRQPLIIDRNRSWVKYLFNPEMNYRRHVMQADLSDEEQRYLKRTNRWAWLNLVSPQAFFIPKFKLGDRSSFTFSLNHLRTPFGEIFGQNIWLMHNYTQLHGIFVKQYRNYETTNFGIGYKLYDIELFRDMYMTSSVDFWQQPTDFNFRATSSFNGFRVGQIFEYQVLKNQFSDRNRLSFLLGYDYKSKGYMPESFFIEENFNVKAGLKWNFR
jgi:hypothetical protein